MGVLHEMPKRESACAGCVPVSSPGHQVRAELWPRDGAPHGFSFDGAAPPTWLGPGGVDGVWSGMRPRAPEGLKAANQGHLIDIHSLGHVEWCGGGPLTGAAACYVPVTPRRL